MDFIKNFCYFWLILKKQSLAIFVKTCPIGQQTATYYEIDIDCFLLFINDCLLTSLQVNSLN